MEGSSYEDKNARSVERKYKEIENKTAKVDKWRVEKF